MLFNSFLFLIFFGFVYILYWALRGRARIAFLIGASVLFYSAWGLQSEGWSGLRWTLHFVVITFLNYLLIHAMFRYPLRKKSIITAIIVIDILNLATFKYFAFFRDSLHNLSLRLPEKLDALNLFLPLAISFYTFQLIAYAMDVYRGVIKEKVPVGRFFLFFLFFPHFIAGPIMRASDLMPQIDKPWVDRNRMMGACWLILGGLVKKVLLADPMGQIVAPVFREPDAYSGLSIILGGACFSLQVYCDFSGYTDIARGCAFLLGFDIPENFSAPFFARSARELWQRWHITLATWLRDYLYIPLGGSRRSEIRNHLNLIITFTLGGFWHGADISYILWGFFWGALLSLERFLENNMGWKTTPEKSRAGMVLKGMFMFLLFSIGALFFRTQPVRFADHSYTTWQMLGHVFGGIFTNTDGELLHTIRSAGMDPAQIGMVFGPAALELRRIGPIDTVIWMFLALGFFHWVQYSPARFARFKEQPWLLGAAAALLGGILIPSLVSGTGQFIYFVF